MDQIAIIGAGSAGLAAASVLARQGITPILYEKSQSVGGRNATRRVEGCVIDHGAQCLKTSSPNVLQLIAGSRDAAGNPAFDIGRPVWVFDASGTIAVGDPAQNAEAMWSWPGGVRTLCEGMARGLDVRRGVAIQAVQAMQRAQGYTLLDMHGSAAGSASAVLLTAPAPQSAAIIRASLIDSSLKQQLLDELAHATYRRCLSLTLAYARRPEVPWYAVVNTDRQHPITWLACEHVKPGHAPADTGLIIAQMSHDFSVEHWEAVERGTYGKDAAPLPAPLMRVHALVQSLLPDDPGPPLWVDVQRWRYALPDSSADFDRLNRTGSGLFFAGDAFTGQGRVHLAIENGWRVAELIVQSMTRDVQ